MQVQTGQTPHSLKQQAFHKQLAQTTPKTTQSRPRTPVFEQTETVIGGKFYVHRENHPFGETQAIARGVTHKTRLFGQSHWMNTAVMFGDIFGMIGSRLRGETSKPMKGIQKCKALATTIKAQRTPSTPCLPTNELPSKELCDQLVDRYLSTIERLYRIIHIPSFRQSYEALWAGAKSDAAFLLTVKLVLAIGAVTHDASFSLRPSAIRWIYEAQTAMSEPRLKQRLNIEYLQISLLLLLARDIVDVNSDLTWISVGSLYRTAIYMGLNRDPSQLPRRSLLAAEMRRRLWNTILEIMLQTSLMSGGPPLVSLNEFDTMPPGNFDDEQLAASETTTTETAPRPEHQYTQTSVAIALRKTFSARLATVKFLNNLNSNGSYEETLRIDNDIRAGCKELRRTIHGYKTSSTGPWPLDFEISTVDFLLHRYISALHMPFFGASLQETKYAFTRKIVLESALKIWYAAYPPHDSMLSGSDKQSDLLRLTTSGHGLFRSVTLLATLIVALELRAQLQEDAESLTGPITIRPDLVTVLENSKVWCRQCIEAGETNIKGHLLMSIVMAQIQALMRGVRQSEMPELLVRAAEDSVDLCVMILEEKAAAGTGLVASEGFHQMETPSSIPSDMASEFDFMGNASLFDFGAMENMNWDFSDANMSFF
ncbi:Hypothetical protein R9X50_00187300 [Acrodontium crateriforme]|uniref:Xylanolytic transcriptional activator regulatory domain-containing protein n=1 Tax=Acrodontium crateriforme TaxID=150365 RepID=A0AAQ3R665_9PEZI|nr:Hypothetical protein R9X50_00187300 [Acrodontium crateriforme]